MATSVNRKELHDRLLAQAPDGVDHTPCDLCDKQYTPEGGTQQVQTYTAEEVQAAVDAAIAEVRAQVESAAQESEIEAHVAAIKAEADAAVEELRAKLDEAVLKEQAAVEALATYKAGIEELVEAETAKAEIAARRDERLAQVKEVASFPEEYLEANADRFAAMSDEDFEARLAEYAAMSSKTAGDRIPAKTALTSSRETASDSRGFLREFMRDSLAGVDPRTI